MSGVKTKKVKKDRRDKKALWDKFDEEVASTNEPIQCVYRTSGERETCDCCGNQLALTIEGFQACQNSKCGVVYTDTIDRSAEWRYYGAEDSGSSDPTRCGMPINPLLKESSFGCKVLCNGGSSHEMRKIKRYTEWMGMPYREKSQYDEFQRISMLAQQGGIAKIIVDDAMRYHKRISEARTFRGENREGIIAASLYISSRINQFPRTPKEIAEIFNLDSDVATKGCKNAVNIINGLEHELDNNERTRLCMTTPSSFIDRYCSKLRMTSDLNKICMFVAIRIERNKMVPENTPHSIAAGIVYFVAQICNAAISKQAVSDVSGISEVTINKCFKKLDSLKNVLIPSQVLDQYTRGQTSR